jgi:hypothetical protein
MFVLIGEEAMKRQWRTRRQVLPQSDGQRRWDRAYQLLLDWTGPSELADTTSSPAAPSPVRASDLRVLALPPICSREEVEQDACCPVCARLDPATGSAANR